MGPNRRRLCYLFLLAVGVSIGYFYISDMLNSNEHLVLTDSNRNTMTVLTDIYYNKTSFKVETKYLYPTASNSRTKPPYYPLNGTGHTVNILGDFDVERFNDFCEMDKDLVAVISVYSAPGNFERRKAMRETVGKTCSKLRCKMFFIVGVSLDTTVYRKVKDEHSSMKDILIIDKIDTYRDLNNKAVAMLDWLIEYCRKPKYVIHIIDDFYPNLKMIIDQMNAVQRSKFILGCEERGAKAIRNKASKWFVSEDEYPYARYLPYPTGVVYAFRNDECALLRLSVHAVEYCWIEDSWFMGHVRLGAGFETVSLKWYLDFNAKHNWKNIWTSHSGIHQIQADHFYVIYNHTVQT